MEDLLRKVSRGELSVEDAAAEIDKRLFGGEESNIDPGRHSRTGVPEVIIAEGKTEEQIISISIEFIHRMDRAIISRLHRERAKKVIEAVRSNIKEVIVEYDDIARFLVLKVQGSDIIPSGGRVGIITAGTSDIAVAKEAELMVREMGCETRMYNDVGVAGMHRILTPLKELREWDADSIVVAAGREGALPTLVSGLTDVPVIGLPVSTGYGIHGKGETALFAMLQSCSPLAVVNIDSGFTAGAIAGKIAVKMGRSRE